MSNFNEDQMIFSFQDNGDVYEMIDGGEGKYVGRIDSDSDWRPVDGCQYSESEIRDDLENQVDYFDDWNWSEDFLAFMKG